MKHGCHYFCCFYLETLTKLIGRSFNPNCDKFTKVISCLPLAKLKQIGIGLHIESAGLRNCRDPSFEFVYLLETCNPRTNYLSLFTSAKSKAAYEGWKGRLKGMKAASHEEVSTSIVDLVNSKSAFKVLAQPLTQADISLKYAKFVAESEVVLGESSASPCEIEAFADIVNYEMAVLKTLLPISQDLADLAANRSRKYCTKLQSSKLDSEIREKLRLTITNHLEVQGLKPSSDKGEAVVLQLYRDGAVEVRLNHKNTTFIFKVHVSSEEQRFWERPGVLSSFLFETPDEHSISGAQSSPRLLEPDETNHRKFSLGNCSQDSAVCDLCWSNSSTLAGSESGLQKPTEEVFCDIRGELSFEIESPKGRLAKGSGALSMHLFLTAKDKASKALVQALPDIKHLVNTAIVESFFMLAMC